MRTFLLVRAAVTIPLTFPTNVDIFCPNVFTPASTRVANDGVSAVDSVRVICKKDYR
jgi:hypothetical protein